MMDARENLRAPVELRDEELDLVAAAGGSLINVSDNNVEVGVQAQVLTNQTAQGQIV